MKHPPQEQDLLPGRRIAGVGIGVVLATVLGALVAYGIGDCGSRTGSGIAWTPGQQPQSPPEINGMETRVFTVEAQGIAMHDHAEALLSEYGWVDTNRGIVRVPIDVAIDVVVSRAHQHGASR